MARKKKNMYDELSDYDSYFAKELVELNNSELEKKIVLLARTEEDLKEAKKEDTDLQSLEEQVRTARKAHTEPLKVNRLKRAIVFDVMRSRES